MRAKSFVSALASVAAVATLAGLAAWAQVSPPHPGGAMMSGAAHPITKAVAVLHATKSGGEASGEVTFTQTAAGMQVVADIRGLTPGLHGFHIHEFGDCSSPDAMSAGGHFNPMGTMHADRTARARHVGDLGNIEADAKGHARLDIVDPGLNFHGATSILGRGLIVHANPDDLKTQPTGNAGGRVACGVIGVANTGHATPAPAPAAVK